MPKEMAMNRDREQRFTARLCITPLPGETVCWWMEIFAWHRVWLVETVLYASLKRHIFL